MTDGIDIPVNLLDNTAKGASSVANSLKGLDGTLSNINSRALQAGQAATQLNNAFSRGDITAKQYDRGLKQIAWQYSTTGEKIQHFRQRMNDLQGTMLRFGVAGASVALAGKQIYSLARSGAEIQYTEQKFNRFAQTVGLTGGTYLKQLREATRGTVNDFQLLQQGTSLLQLGLADTGEEAVRLAKIQTALGMDTGELTLALANQSKRRLDQLGLSLKRFNEIEQEMKSRGMEGPDAFKAAFIQTAEETIQISGNMADSILGDYQRLEASASNLFEDAKKATAENLAPVARDVSMFLSGYRELISGERVMDWNAVFGGGDSWVRQATLMDFAQYAQRPQSITGPGFRGAGGGIGEAAPGRSLITNQLDLMTRYYQGLTGGGAGAAGAAPDTTNYEAILGGALKLTEANKKQSETLSEINQKLIEQRQLANEMVERGYGPTNQKLLEVRDNITQLSAAQQEAGAAALENMNAIMLSNIANASAEEDRAKNQLDFALATGQMTQQAYSEQTALLGIADAFAAGTITADEAAMAVQAVYEQLSLLDGMSVMSFIDIVVRGNIPAYTAFETTEDLRNITNAGGSTTAMAGGGSFSGWGLVGDTAAGPTAYSELVYAPQGAYVYNATKTRKMLAGGSPKGYAAGGWVPPIGDFTQLDTTVTLPSPNVSGGKANSPSGGGSGSDVVTVSQLSNTVAPVISEAVVAAVAATMPGVEAAVIQTIAASVQHQQQQAQNSTIQTGLLKELNDNLLTLISRTASAKDIGRSVQTAVQTGV